MTDKRRVVALEVEEIAAVERALNSAIAKRFSMNARDVIRYALIHCDELFASLEQRETEITEIKRGLKAVILRVDEAMELFEDVTKETRGRPKRRSNAKLTDEEKTEEGRLICEELEGIIQGNMCFYKKREITPTNTPAEYEVGLPLNTLTEQTVKEQYFPSREEYEALVVKQKS